MVVEAVSSCLEDEVDRSRRQTPNVRPPPSAKVD